MTVDLDRLYFAPLKAGKPQEGMGLYEHGTGRCVYYSDGGEWFFESGTGTPTFYVADGCLHRANGERTKLRLPGAEGN